MQAQYLINCTKSFIKKFTAYSDVKCQFALKTENKSLWQVRASNARHAIQPKSVNTFIFEKEILP